MNEKQFEGRSAIVTGGTRGIGKAIVLELARRGCNVAFNYSKSAEEADKLKAEVEGLGVKAYAAQCDVANTEASAEFAGTKSVFPTDLDEALTDRIQRTAVNAFEALRLRDYARIDMRVKPSGEIFVIEVNPNCYLERNAEFARSAEQDGVNYHALIANIVELASARYAR